MTKHQFDILSEKYNAGTCTPEEILLLEKWAGMHYAQHDDSLIFADADDMRDVGERIWKKLDKDAPLSPLNRRWLMNRWLWTAAAACLTLTLGYLYIRNAKQFADLTQRPVKGIETKNVAHTRHKVTLPDGSTVVLEENASIITEESYGRNTRSVHLTGEAFFDIVKNEKVPFLVHTGDLVTEVLGTSFRIKPEKEDGLIEVSVKTGRVSVYATDPGQSRKRNGVIITPNQKVVYDAKNHTIRPDIVDVPEMIIARPPVSDFQFEEKPIDNVLKLMQKVYGVDIVVANPALNHCAFTGDLNGLTMYKQLDFVCGVINAEYEIRGTTIFINGQGCKENE